MCGRAWGIHRIGADDGTLVAQSNPIACRNAAPQFALYWGDSHGGQVAMAEKIPDFFRYARDVAAIHFAGYQRNDHVLSKRDWVLQQETERAYNQPGNLSLCRALSGRQKPRGAGITTCIFDGTISRFAGLGMRDWMTSRTRIRI